MELSRREREQQERESFIISKSIELFCEFGFENVSMDQIAKESEFTKRTLYRYFQSKVDLYYAAALRGHQYLYNMLDAAIKQGDTGYEKIRNAYYAYYEYCKQYPALSQLANKRQYNNLQTEVLSSPFYKQFCDIDQIIFQELRHLYELGFEDKSIQADDDIDYLTYTTIYTAVSFFHLFSFTGETYTKHLGLEKEKFVIFTIEHMLSQIKGK